MIDYLDSIVRRTVCPVPEVRPRLAALFDRSPHGESDLPSEVEARTPDPSHMESVGIERGRESGHPRPSSPESSFQQQLSFDTTRGERRIRELLPETDLPAPRPVQLKQDQETIDTNPRPKSDDSANVVIAPPPATIFRDALHSEGAPQRRVREKNEFARNERVVEKVRPQSSERPVEHAYFPRAQSTESVDGERHGLHELVPLSTAAHLAPAPVPPRAAVTAAVPQIAETVVHVTIGRVEVRAHVGEQRGSTRTSAQREPTQGLADYLRGSPPGRSW